MSAAIGQSPQRPAPRLAALVVSPETEHRQAWIGSLRKVGIGHVLEAIGANDAVQRGRSATGHGVCIVEALPQEGSTLQAIRELRRQGWLRLVLVSSRNDESTVRLAMAAKVRSFVVQPSSRPRPPEPLQPEVSSRVPELSNREIEVVQHVANGHTNREIGEKLSLSALTVKSHLSRVGRKLGTGDRAQMVAICFRAGIVS
ncbi:MAG: LuxR C-terminal-related transcriptional regulator [Actinomycetia bacterium]|nr:LuxR C-terminal-related transcriptional regulator [Actinomycetes bacterium]MCH9800199.1 LuxR C-terminal-related transcriptional regulator [Actinomycetes bacterium]